MTVLDFKTIFNVFIRRWLPPEFELGTLLATFGQIWAAHFGYPGRHPERSVAHVGAI